MSINTIPELKAKFETGDRPDGGDFVDLIDTLYKLDYGVVKVGSGCEFTSLQAAIDGNASGQNFQVVGTITESVTIEKNVFVSGLDNSSKIVGNLIINDCIVQLETLDITGNITVSSVADSATIKMRNTNQQGNLNLVNNFSSIECECRNCRFSNNVENLSLHGTVGFAVNLQLFNTQFVNSGVVNAAIYVYDDGAAGTILNEGQSLISHIFIYGPSFGKSIDSSQAISPQLFLSLLHPTPGINVSYAGLGNIVV